MLRRGRSRAPTTRSSTLGRADRAALAAAAEGSLLGAYAFTTYRTNGNRKAPLARLSLITDAADANDVIATAAAVGEAVRTARDLVNTPPNDLYPETFAARARELAEAAGLEVEVLDDAALAEAGFGGVLGVGQGSSRKPRLVRLRWAGGPSPRAHVALVGKGITFDTGGISIKPAANMDHMTSDMSGAAAVIATTVLAATLELPVAVTATVPMAENMPSDTAYRPGDVLRMYGGRTVEVLNTDAEGRLILADAIVRAGEDSPDYLIETSTLTGAQMVALGTRTMGIMGEEAFRDRVAALARDCGEDGWAMPLPDHIRADLDSRVADLANVTGQRWGGMLVAGTFLREFVPDGLAWAHLDIAGPSFHTGSPYGYTDEGRHRRARAHPARGAGGHRRERLTHTVAGSHTSPAVCASPTWCVWAGVRLRRGGAVSAVGRRGRACAAGSPRAARRRPAWRGGGRACAPRPDPPPGAGSTRHRPRRAASSSP